MISPKMDKIRFCVKIWYAKMKAHTDALKTETLANRRFLGTNPMSVGQNSVQGV